MVIGLGNPGLQYQNNRHNVGFKVVELLSEKLNSTFNKKLFQPFLISKCIYKNHRIVLIKPLTFMNSSGIIVPYLFKKYKMDINNLIVLCDNLDLNPGRCKFKLKGSPAAHNGLKSISNALDSNDYKRIFLGIGHPGKRSAVKDYVLGDPDENDLSLYHESYKNAADALLKISEDLEEQVMNELNRKKDSSEGF